MMRHSSSLLFSIGILLGLFGRSSVIGNSQACAVKGEGKGFAYLSSGLDNNFESGGLQPWIEESTTSVKWKIEDYFSPWETSNASPQPLNGQTYLRVHRGPSLSFGIAVLRSPTFTLFPNENSVFSFSFWIRSKWPQFTNLELYLAENGNEKLLSSLYNYSDITNLEWQTHSVTLIGDSSSTLSLAFYAYCGTNVEDAVAIDDIVLTLSQQSTTISFSVTDFTTEEITTTVIPNTDTPTTTPPENTFTSSTSTTTTPITTPTSTPTSTPTMAPTTTPTTEFTTIPSTESPTSPTTMTYDTTTIANFFTCPDNIDFKYPDPNNPCSKKYYHCENCVATEQECPQKQIFYNQTQSCRPCVQVPSCDDECRN